MKAVIMAGGKGTRLRPLTEGCPKPMARLCGRPAVEYMLELLAENGVTECVMTLQYLPEHVTSHFEGKRFAGMGLDFCMEHTPLGTAGSVKNAVGAATESVLVVSGDALCDFSLKKAMEMHLKSKAAATIVTATVADPREYGLVIAEKDGAISGFIEKPSYAQAISELANTGIYLLSPEALALIPDGQMFDFASELFPQMMERGMLLQNCTLEGYWCDIGDLAAYRKAQADMLTEKVRCNLRGTRDEWGNVFAGRRPAGHYRLDSPVYIGAGVHIGDNAAVGPGSVLDDGATVSAGASVEGSILLPRCVAGERVGLHSAVICAGASVKSGAVLLEGAAVGENAVIGARAVVKSGVRVTGAARIPDGTVLSDHVHTRCGAASAFDDNGLCGEVGVELTPEMAARVGCAIGTVASGAPVGLAAAEPRCARVLGGALAAGIRSAGTPVLDFGCAFEALFAFAMGYNALKLGVYLCTGETGAIKVVCDAGLPATRKVEREIEIALARGEFARAPRDGFGDCVDMAGIGVMYLSALLRLAPEGLEGMHARVRCENRGAGRILEDVLKKLGCDDSAEDAIGLHLSENGRSLSLSQGEVLLNPHRAVAAYCMTLFEQKQDVAVENDFPRAIEEMAREQGQRVYRYLLCPADGSDESGRRLAATQQCARDGLMLAVSLLSYLRKNNLTLRELDKLLPPFVVEERAVEIDCSPAKVLRDIAGERAGEGVVIRQEKGVVLLRPRKNGSAIRVFAEAANWETAKELCADITKRLAEQSDR